MKTVWVSRIDELLAAKSRKERRQIPIEELARAVGVSRQTIYTWKSFEGVNSIPAEHTAKLCEFFGVDEWALWKLEEVNDDNPGQIVAAPAV